MHKEYTNIKVAIVFVCPSLYKAYSCSNHGVAWHTMFMQLGGSSLILQQFILNGSTPSAKSHDSK